MSKPYSYKLHGTANKLDKAKAEAGLRRSYNLQLDRSLDAEQYDLEIAEDEVVELEFDDGGIWYMAPDEFDEFVKLDQKNRSLAANATPTIPIRIQGRNQDRGWGDVLLKVVSIFAPAVTAIATDELARRTDKKLIPNEGLFLVGSDFTLHPINPEQYFSPATEDQAPVLLLIHGTFSSTEGSFSELKGSTTWSALYDKYEGRVLALEHYTLSKSPLENLLDLLPFLPKHLPVHLITHSRGGLIGDLLARTSEGIFSPKEIALLQGTDFDREVEFLQQLNELIPDHQVRVQKYVRTAAPAQGTTLMSKRLDMVLNIILNLTKQIPSVVGQLIGEAIAELVRAFVEQRVEADVVPGLAAMVPGSPFQQLINSDFKPLTSELSIIAGDAASAGFKLKGLKQSIMVILTDAFFLEDNDFVVDTKSMYGGFVRTKAPFARLFSGERVNHFSYFGEAGSQEAILDCLSSSPGFPSRGFNVVPQQEEEERGLIGLEDGDLVPEKITGKHPLVILLPGIMGSNLSMNDEQIWLNYGRILNGSITRLDIDNQAIEATSLVATPYQALVEYLKEKKYEVLVFPFDWRRSTTEAAQLLNKEIGRIRKKLSPPSIQIVAHSMGGLVVRSLMINHPATWTGLNAMPGFRTILMGTPWRGSYLIPQTLTGHGDTIRSLHRFSLTKTMTELLQVFSKFPGLYELLPLEGYDFGSEEIWNILKDLDPDGGWVMPTKGDLRAFRTYREKVLKSLPKIDYSNIIYVAGQDDKTTDNILLSHGRLIWKKEYTTKKDNQALAKKIKALKQEGKSLSLGYSFTAKGDGSVSWELGIPQENDKPIAQVYYQATPHGDLANDPQHFAALLDLIKRGETNKLSQNQPPVTDPVQRSTRGDMPLGNATIPTPVPTTDAGLIARFMGRRTVPLYEKKERPKVALDVSLKMGHLKYAKHPVMVGHFQGEDLRGVEYILDAMLHNELREQMQLGIYPGRVNTSLVLLANETRVIESVIVGMGYPEDLRPLRLARCIEHSCLAYAKQSVNEGHAGDKPLGISPLLIGSAYGGLTISGCVNAILEGVVAANDKIMALNESRQENRYYSAGSTEDQIAQIPLIEMVEFIEIFRPKALKTFKVLYRIERDNNVYPIRLNRDLKVVEGSRDILPIADENTWWMRLNIQKVPQEILPGQPTKGPSYSYSASTGRARIERVENSINPQIIRKLLEESAFEERWDRKKFKALFTYLIPNEFKLSFESQQNITLVLDDDTAAIPWELLHFDEESGVPLCVRTGFIRQLATKNPSTILRAKEQARALIIGDPELHNEFNQLTGAAEEAQDICNLLRENGFSTELLLNETATTIYTEFPTDYNILHVASHGVVDYPTPNGTKSGILIGEDDVISPDEVATLGTIPELVFLNCCHLGKISPEQEKYFLSRNRLAANLGAAFIRAGAKAVIVAGWAINDQAAADFAHRFYERMLTPNVTFGDAVKEARSYCYQRYRNSHTWGAYQCYGDQAYRLPRAKTSYQGKAKTYEFLLPQEAIITLEQILDKTKSARLRGINFMDDLQRIMQAVRILKFDKSHPYTIELAASICAELGHYQKAASYYLQLKEAKKAVWFVRSFEQYFNVQMAAHMATFSAAQTPEEKDEIYGIMVNLKERFDRLCEEDLLDTNGERYNLIGSANKRCYLAASEDNKQAHLDQAATSYRKALLLDAKKGEQLDFYPLCNWLPIALVASDQEKAEIKKILGKKGPQAYVLDYFSEAEEKPIAKTNFWDEVKQVNIMTTLIFVWRGRKDRITYYKDEIKKRYRRAWRKGGSVKNRESEAFQMQFLAAAVEAPEFKKEKFPEEKKKAFRELQQFFQNLDKN